MGLEFMDLGDGEPVAVVTEAEFAHAVDEAVDGFALIGPCKRVIIEQILTRMIRETRVTVRADMKRDVMALLHA